MAFECCIFLIDKLVKLFKVIFEELKHFLWRKYAR